MTLNQIDYDLEIEKMYHPENFMDIAVSNCCGAEVIDADLKGHGRCAECKENCISVIEE